MLKRLPIAAALAVLCQNAFAQVSTRPEIEISHAPQRLFALTNARVVVSATNIREGVILVIDEGLRWRTITLSAAEILGVSDRLGSIDVGH